MDRNKVVHMGKLHPFDLAVGKIQSFTEAIDGSSAKALTSAVSVQGSDRQSKSGATSHSLKEATKINLLLFTLGKVITSLADERAHKYPRGTPN